MSNLISLIYNIKLVHINRQAVIIISMAVSDILMGLYICILSAADTQYKSTFPMFLEVWKSSVLCKVLNMLFFVSVHVSFFSLLVIAVNHYIALCRTLNRQKISKQINLMVLILVWIILVIPMLFLNFLDSFEVKLPLCFTFQSSVTVKSVFGSFIIINMFVLAIICYIYKQAANSVKESLSNTFEKKRMCYKKFVRKIALVILTNVTTLLAYFSVIVSTLVNVNIATEVYTWIIACAVTCNACMNPILHTASTRRFHAYFHQRKLQG